MQQSSGYGIIYSIFSNELVTLPEFNIGLPLPASWRIDKNEHQVNLLDEQGNTIGAIEQVGGYFLPNHSYTLSDKKIKGGLGESRLLVLSRQSPAASGTDENWQEVHAMLPLKGQSWLDFWVKVGPGNDVGQLQTILENAIAGAVYYIPGSGKTPNE